ncbi:MAG: GFA family protein [Arenimonas sp.]|nr:GFA family protein [Arenimonas sp.]
MDEQRTGACLCGAVRFRTHGPLRDVVFCHCSQCRRQTGLYYAATDVPRDRIALSGEDLVGWYRSSEEARRGFCQRCGSALFWLRDGSDHISVMAGAFDQPSRLVAGYHIFCADKGEFYAIDDGLPAVKAGRPG